MNCLSEALGTAIESGDLDVIRRVAEDAGAAAASALFTRPAQRPEVLRRIEVVLHESGLLFTANMGEIQKLAHDVWAAVSEPVSLK